MDGLPSSSPFVYGSLQVHLPCCHWWGPEAVQLSSIHTRQSSGWIQTNPQTTCSLAAWARWKAGPQRGALREFWCYRTLPLKKDEKWSITAIDHVFFCYFFSHVLTLIINHGHQSTNRRVFILFLSSKKWKNKLRWWGQKSGGSHKMKTDYMKAFLCAFAYLKTQIQTWRINNR